MHQSSDCLVTLDSSREVVRSEDGGAMASVLLPL